MELSLTEVAIISTIGALLYAFGFYVGYMSRCPYKGTRPTVQKKSEVEDGN